MPGGDGGLAAVLFGLEAPDAKTKDLFLPGQLATLLPAGTYRFANAPHDARLAALAFALGSLSIHALPQGEARKRAARAAGRRRRRGARAHRRGA